VGHGEAPGGVDVEDDVWWGVGLVLELGLELVMDVLGLIDGVVDLVGETDGVLDEPHAAMSTTTKAVTAPGAKYRAFCRSRIIGVLSPSMDSRSIDLTNTGSITLSGHLGILPLVGNDSCNHPYPEDNPDEGPSTQQCRDNTSYPDSRQGVIVRAWSGDFDLVAQDEVGAGSSAMVVVAGPVGRGSRRNVNVGSTGRCRRVL
jgi:hypothetical protein